MAQQCKFFFFLLYFLLWFVRLHVIFGDLCRKMTTSHVLIVEHCPYMVGLTQEIEGRIKLCGGTVLTMSLTLTAAHCLVFGTIGLYLHYGSVHIFLSQVYEATTVILHENFNVTTLDHDIGIVSISPKKVIYNQNIRPIKLPRGRISLHSKIKLEILGWGAISEHERFSKQLRSAWLPVVDRPICRYLLGGYFPDNTFCLGYPDGHVDACLGDSGGPAMLGDVQIGIISFGEACAEPLKPGVYTDLRKYLHWIRLAKKVFH